MRFGALFLSVFVLLGCGKAVRDKTKEMVWHIKGNILITLESGKQQLQVEMYGQKGDFWLIEGRDVFFSGRIFWFLSTSFGTNYIISDIHKSYWMVVDPDWSDVLVDKFPLFFEKGEYHDSYMITEEGWVKSYEKGNWRISVRKRFSDGMPRIILIEGNNQKIFFDLDKTERGSYYIPRYENLPWKEVLIISGQSVWEVIYE